MIHGGVVHPHLVVVVIPYPDTETVRLFRIPRLKKRGLQLNIILRDTYLMPFMYPSPGSILTRTLEPTCSLT